MTTKQDEYPIWARYEFLERDLKDEKKGESSEEQDLSNEIKRLKHENRDFVAELQRLQNLLTLQTDIEKENRQYYEQEKARLKILA